MLATLAQSGNGVALKIAVPSVAWKALAPALILIGGAFLILGWAAMTRKGAKSSIFAIATIVTAATAMLAAVPLWREVTDPHKGPYTAVKGAVAVDGFSVFFTFLICSELIRRLSTTRSFSEQKEAGRRRRSRWRR